MDNQYSCHKKLKFNTNEQYCTDFIIIFLILHYHCKLKCFVIYYKNEIVLFTRLKKKLIKRINAGGNI